MSKIKNTRDLPAQEGGLMLQGLVISHLGQGLAVESAEGEIFLCNTLRRIGDVAVGDRVLWEICGEGLGRIAKILPRRSVLTRPGYGGKIRAVAANLDKMYVVIAPEPEPDLLLVDQFLAVCEHRQIKAELVINKIDLMEDCNILDDYRQIGYAIHKISTKSGEGLESFEQSLKDHCSILSGQSGVGKSSITNHLFPDKRLQTNTLSTKSGLGKHTTTAATLYHLPQGGDLIDSPGLSVFGLAQITTRDLAYGYVEFQGLIAQCQFNDCLHTHPKGCAVHAELDAGRISQGRYQRYIKLLDKLAYKA